MLRDAPKELQAGRELVCVAVAQDWEALEYAAPELRADDGEPPEPPAPARSDHEALETKRLCAVDEIEELLAMVTAAGPEFDMAAAMVHVAQAQVVVSAVLGSASAELVGKTPDEPWALIASSLEPQDLGSLNCTAKRFGEPGTWNKTSDEKWSLVEEAARLQIHHGNHDHPWLSIS